MAFIEDAIQSVLAQTLQSFEIILVNDGSTDHSGAICELYQKKDSRIKYFEQANAGVSVARNNGLLNAIGEYVFFMDSDDTLDPDFLRTSLNAAKKGSNDIVLIGAYYLQRLPHLYCLPTCAQMWRRSFLQDHPDIRFPAYIQPCEDGLFSHQLLALTSKLGVNPKGTYHYRQHSNQNHFTINENTGNVIQQIPKWFDILEQFYTRYNLFQTHALHLALFIEHEPFEFRYLKMHLNDNQKYFLHTLIKQFITKNVFPYLKETDKKYLQQSFLYFLKASTHTDFDIFYQTYSKKRARQKKIYMLLTKLVFVNTIKQRLRKSIRKKFHE